MSRCGKSSGAKASFRLPKERKADVVPSDDASGVSLVASAVIVDHTIPGPPMPDRQPTWANAHPVPYARHGERVLADTSRFPLEERPALWRYPSLPYSQSTAIGRLRRSNQDVATTGKEP